MSNLTTLKSMFPSLSEDVISVVLQQNNNDLQQCIDELLTNTSGNYNNNNNNNVPLSSSPSAPPHVSIPVSRPPTSDVSAIARKAISMASDSEARRLASMYGLDINTVSWEDNARSKNSSWGPCISDMTLEVGTHQMPVIRPPNYSDLTWDVPMDKIPLVVGNETGGPLYTVTLKEYLEKFRMYLHDSTPANWAGSDQSLLAAERDSHVIMSAQACFLPVPATGSSNFNVAIFNYQSYPREPAVLAIVSTIAGTSAQAITGGNQKLYFNKKGQKASFVAQRLSDDRRQRGVAVEGEMTTEEKQQNMIMIIQIPLENNPPMSACWDDGGDFESAPMQKSSSAAPRRQREQSDVEDAIVKVGEDEGVYSEIGGLKIKRDHRFPVRVTLQYYKCTSNGVVNDDNIRTIATQLESARKNADAIGSLVVAGKTDRPTEHNVHSSGPIVIPPWWNNYWLTYSPNFRGVSEDEARTAVFKDSRYSSSSMSEAQDHVTRILNAYTSFKSGQSTPLKWI
eukprot:TRINITY_DN1324_c1_g1_i2.p1 TRINITY_DN1324_c1_g1~~TRINITY_DN1324_c1_g1_i2.p1  ORF type:complete len:552 (+),score=143.09 TRINITY_DN1324_c1_g1_i2:127-1656(+)